MILTYNQKVLIEQMLNDETFLENEKSCTVTLKTVMMYGEYNDTDLKALNYLRNLWVKKLQSDKIENYFNDDTLW